jgi:hypothetical protein
VRVVGNKNRPVNIFVTSSVAVSYEDKDKHADSDCGDHSSELSQPRPMARTTVPASHVPIKPKPKSARELKPKMVEEPEQESVLKSISRTIGDLPGERHRSQQRSPDDRGAMSPQHSQHSITSEAQAKSPTLRNINQDNPSQDLRTISHHSWQDDSLGPTWLGRPPLDSLSRGPVSHIPQQNPPQSPIMRIDQLQNNPFRQSRQELEHSPTWLGRPPLNIPTATADFPYSTAGISTKEWYMAWPSSIGYS